jgi:hypothetical protein
MSIAQFAAHEQKIFYKKQVKKYARLDKNQTMALDTMGK